MPWLYILKCADGSYYTGTTWDLEKRLWEHRQGIEGSYTYGKRPVHVVFTQEFPSWTEAVVRERQVKGWTRKKKEALIRSDFDELKRLAKKK
jgi:predicted GIY-YIG superfamily endonuclease